MSKRSAKIISVMIWVISVMITAVPMYITKVEIVYDTDLFRCLYNRGKASFLRFVVYMVATVIPMISIVLFNMVLLFYGYRAAVTHGLGTRKAPVTALCLSGLFVISTAPFIIYTLISALQGANSNNDPYIVLKLTSGCIYYVNIFGNPIIYTITNRRFYNFCKMQVLDIVCVLTCSERPVPKTRFSETVPNTCMLTVSTLQPCTSFIDTQRPSFRDTSQPSFNMDLEFNKEIELDVLSEV